MGRVSKRMKAAAEAVKGKTNLPLEEAVALVKENATARFDETVECAINLGVDPRHADQMVRGAVNLPNGTGKAVRVAVFSCSTTSRGPGALSRCRASQNCCCRAITMAYRFWSR